MTPVGTPENPAVEQDVREVPAPRADSQEPTQRGRNSDPQACTEPLNKGIAMFFRAQRNRGPRAL